MYLGDRNVDFLIATKVLGYQAVKEHHSWSDADVTTCRHCRRTPSNSMGHSIKDKNTGHPCLIEPDWYTHSHALAFRLLDFIKATQSVGVTITDQYWQTNWGYRVTLIGPDLVNHRSAVTGHIPLAIGEAVLSFSGIDNNRYDYELFLAEHGMYYPLQAPNLPTQKELDLAGRRNTFRRFKDNARRSD